jgi:perosamine synthetase
LKKIYYAKPSITNIEIDAVTDAIRNGWGAHCYDYIFKFADSFSKYQNVSHALPTSSGTGALHVALAALGIKRGDEVIVPDITWIASVSPIVYLGAKPVFVDILPDTWCIDPRRIEEAITNKTKAIIVVHLYGNLVEMDDVLEISKKYNIPVIEDSAEALGSEYKGKKAGTIGDFGIFSFHGTKTVTTGEGGMLVTDDDDLFERATIISDHGRNPKERRQFWCDDIGLKYKISNLQAALGFAQMQRVEDLVDKKREIFLLYKEYLCRIRGITLNSEKPYTRNSFWMPTVIFDKSLNINRDELQTELRKNNIDTRVFFYPVSMFTMFGRRRNNKVSYDIFYRGLNLPSYFEITEDEIEYVCECLIKNIS